MTFNSIENGIVVFYDPKLDMPQLHSQMFQKVKKLRKKMNLATILEMLS